MEAPPNQPINITPMSAEEAREYIEEINGSIESLALKLLELYRRRGWEALGYESWEECAKVEFRKSRAYLFRLLAAAQVEENLELSLGSTIVDLENIPVSQLTSLAKLPPEQQGEALLRAEEIAQERGKKRSNKEVQEVVREFKGDVLEADVNDDSEEEDSFAISPVEIDTDEICTALISNVQWLSSDQISAVLRSLLPRISEEVFAGWSSEELNDWQNFSQG